MSFYLSNLENGEISSIVPIVSHHDHTEHDVMVVITEQGVADLRGLSPKERAKAIINNCAHPDFRPMLLDYFNRAEGSYTNNSRTVITTVMNKKEFIRLKRFIKEKDKDAFVMASTVREVLGNGFSLSI